MSKSTYYTTCPECGANLDPCERCDCQQENEEQTSFIGIDLAEGSDFSTTTFYREIFDIEE